MIAAIALPLPVQVLLLAVACILPTVDGQRAVKGGGDFGLAAALGTGAALPVFDANFTVDPTTIASVGNAINYQWLPVNSEDTAAEQRLHQGLAALNGSVWSFIDIATADGPNSCGLVAPIIGGPSSSVSSPGWSFEFVWMPTGESATWAKLLDMGTGPASGYLTPGNDDWTLSFDGNDATELLVETYNSATPLYSHAICETQALLLYHWYHVVVVQVPVGDSGAALWFVYFNGLLQNWAYPLNGGAPATLTPVQGANYPQAVDRPFSYIGKSDWDDPNLAAIIDAVRIYDYALTDQQVANLAALYNLTGPVPAPPPGTTAAGFSNASSEFTIYEQAGIDFTPVFNAPFATDPAPLVGGTTGYQWLQADPLDAANGLTGYHQGVITMNTSFTAFVDLTQSAGPQSIGQTLPILFGASSGSVADGSYGWSIDIVFKPLSNQSWSKIFDLGTGADIDSLYGGWLGNGEQWEIGNYITVANALVSPALNQAGSSYLQHTNILNTPPALGAWYHIAWVMQPQSTDAYFQTADASVNATWSVYINGQAVVTAFQGNAPLPVYRHVSYLGRSDWFEEGAGNAMINGTYDAFRVWDRALTASQVLGLAVLYATAPAPDVSSGPCPTTTYGPFTVSMRSNLEAPHWNTYQDGPAPPLPGSGYTDFTTDVILSNGGGVLQLLDTGDLDAVLCWEGPTNCYSNPFDVLVYRVAADGIGNADTPTSEYTNVAFTGSGVNCSIQLSEDTTQQSRLYLALGDYSWEDNSGELTAVYAQYTPAYCPSPPAVNPSYTLPVFTVYADANEAQVFNSLYNGNGSDLLTGLQVTAGQQLLFSSNSSNSTWSINTAGAPVGVTGNADSILSSDATFGASPAYPYGAMVYRVQVAGQAQDPYGQDYYQVFQQGQPQVALLTMPSTGELALACWDDYNGDNSGSAEVSVDAYVSPSPSVHRYNGHSYALTPWASDWLTLNSTAVAAGGYLTTVNDAVEQAFLYHAFIYNQSRFVLTPLWIGYSRTCPLCSTWQWSDGETSTFTYWSPGEPNNALGVEWYAAMNWVSNGEVSPEVAGPYFGIVEFDSADVHPVFARLYTTGPTTAFTFDLPPSASMLASASGSDFTWLSSYDSFDGVAYFDGVSDYIDAVQFADPAGNSPLPAVYGGAVSFEGWVQWASFQQWSRWFEFGGQYGEVLGTGASDNSILSGNEGTGNEYFAQTYGPDPPSDPGAGGAYIGGLQLGVWYHIVISIAATDAPVDTTSASSALVTVYFNGTAETSGGSYLPRYVLRPNSYLGRSLYEFNGDQLFHGYMKGFYFYDYALSAEAASAHFLLPRPPQFELVFASDPRLDGWTPPDLLPSFDYSWSAVDGPHIGVLELSAAAQQYVDLNAPLGPHTVSILMPVIGGPGYASSPTLAPGLSLEFTVKAFSAPASGVLFSCSNRAGADAITVAWQGSSGALVLLVTQTATNQSELLISQSLQLGVYYSIIVTLESGSLVQTAFVNGRTVSSVATSVYPSAVSRSSCLLGASSSTTGFGDWAIDSMRIYDYVLPAGVISALAIDLVTDICGDGICTPDKCARGCPEDCVSVSPSVVLAGDSIPLSVGNLCLLSASFSPLPLEAQSTSNNLVPYICRFAPSPVISVGSNIGTAEAPVVSCVAPGLLLPGTYHIELSLDGGESFLSTAATEAVLAISVIRAVSPLHVAVAVDSTATSDDSSLPFTCRAGQNLSISWLAAGAPALPSVYNEPDLDIQHMDVLLVALVYAYAPSTSLQATPPITSLPLLYAATNISYAAQQFNYTVPVLSNLVNGSILALVQYCSLALSPRLQHSNVTAYMGRRLLSLSVGQVIVIAVIGVALALSLETPVIFVVAVVTFKALLPPVVNATYHVIDQCGAALAAFLPSNQGRRLLSDDGGSCQQSPWQDTNNWGDPHYTTLDGFYYSFYGLGVYQYLIESVTSMSVQQLLLPLYMLTAAELAAWDSVTYSAAIAIRPYELSSIVVLQPTTSFNPLTGACLELWLDGLHISPQGIDSPQSAYAFIGGSLYWSGPSIVTVSTSTGYTFNVQSYCPSYARIGSINMAVPAFAFDHTAGLVGSWDGDASDDLTDADGVNWMDAFPYDSYQAGYSFAETWRVNASQSLFTLAQSVQLTGSCGATGDAACGSFGRRRLLQTGGGGSGEGSVNLADVFSNITMNATAPSVVSPPATWPNATLQQLAEQSCAAAAGTTNMSSAVYQSCLLDLFTSGDLIISSGIATTTIVTLLYNLSAPAVSLVDAATDSLVLLVDLAQLAQQAQCAGGFIDDSALSASFPNTCIPQLLLARASQPTSRTPLSLPFNFTAASSFLLLVPSLQVGSAYLVQSAVVVPALSLSSGLFTTYNFSTLGCAVSCALLVGSSLPCGSDGCGGSCGTCPDGTVCNTAGQQAPDRADGGPFTCTLPALLPEAISATSSSSSSSSALPIPTSASGLTSSPSTSVPSSAGSASSSSTSSGAAAILSSSLSSTSAMLLSSLASSVGSATISSQQSSSSSSQPALSSSPSLSSFTTSSSAKPFVTSSSSLPSASSAPSSSSSATTSSGLGPTSSVASLMSSSSSSSSGGGVVGDPVVVGFHSQSFRLKGLPGRVFNLLSLPNLQFNTLLIPIAAGEVMTSSQQNALQRERMQQAKKLKAMAEAVDSTVAATALFPLPKTTAWNHNGTYMGDCGIKLAGHRLFLTPGHYDTGFANVTLDGKPVHVTSQPLVISTEIQLTRSSPSRLDVSTPELSFSIVNSDHFINTESARLLVPWKCLHIDGLLGQTANPSWQVQRNKAWWKHLEEDFLLPSLDLYSDEFERNQYRRSTQADIKSETSSCSAKAGKMASDRARR